MDKYALISLYDKTNIKYICQILNHNNIKIISSGKTAKTIRKYGFSSYEINNFAKNKEILDGRVKTLNSLLYASILYDRKKINHQNEFYSLNFPIIDYVIVNFYPFEKNTSKIKKDEELIEMIDIGGPSLIRAAAKNYKYVTSIIDRKDYIYLKRDLEKNSGITSIKFRKEMAAKVFLNTSNYDRIISNWFLKKDNNDIIFSNKAKKKLRYGENPHQKGYFYPQVNSENYLNSKIQGKEISYNNILDINAASNCVEEFKENTCVIVKHNNPCGVASNQNKSLAFNLAKQCDPMSAFGGIVAFNYKVDDRLAKNIIKDFYEIIIAKNFTKKALEIFNNKKNLIIIKSPPYKNRIKSDFKNVNFGYLVQDLNNKKITKKNIRCVSKIKGNIKIIDDLIFSMMVSKYVKSNSIVLVKNKATISIGAGQMSRLDSTRIALKKRINKKINFVAASDAFFPFTDNLKLLIKNNCRAIIQPSGSLNDNKIIKYADNHKLVLYFSPYRFFKH